MNWKNASNLDLLNGIKAELIRLGIDDNPSRTKYTELYDRDMAPAATTVMNKTGLSWAEIVKTIGLDYNNRNYSSMTREEILDLAVKASHDSDIRGYKEFMLREKDIKAPAAQTLAEYGIDWEDIQKRHNELYGEFIKPPVRSNSWKFVSTDELLDIVAEEMKSKGFRTISEYTEKRDKKTTPNIGTVRSRVSESHRILSDELSKRLGYKVIQRSGKR